MSATARRHDGADARGNLTCLACDRPRQAGHYLCGGCWRALPAPTRTALNKRDRQAMNRLRELVDQLRDSTPLTTIEVTP